MTPLCGEVDRNVDYAFSEGAFWEPKGARNVPGKTNPGQTLPWAAGESAYGGSTRVRRPSAGLLKMHNRHFYPVGTQSPSPERLDSASWQPGLDK